MSKTATINVRVEPETKKQAEEVFDMLGIPMSTAIEVFLKQVALNKGIPFDITVPPSVNADLMTKEELLQRIDQSLEDYENNKCISFDDFYLSFKEKYNLGEL
ncbi:MAG: type II toxin-antitoxin system RelB/DinJ family antitoxin [Clostridia bacterium]|nr:type II toxin-antitoxin system RelB/DinJ family antitoxin [Clostridia bacterium]